VLDHVGLTRNEFDELKHSFECHFAICFGKQNVSLLGGAQTKVASKPRKGNLQFHLSFRLFSSVHVIISI
jgi:hypothetical protein